MAPKVESESCCVRDDDDEETYSLIMNAGTLKVLRRSCPSRSEHALTVRQGGTSSERPGNGTEQYKAGRRSGMDVGQTGDEFEREKSDVVSYAAETTQ